MEGTPNMHKAVLSVHCHNDLGLAVANSVTAVLAGARQVEVTVNGIGERAGNASLEEFVMALNVRKDRLPFSAGINTKQIWNTSRLLANTIGFPIPRNKPITGENAFAHESGIHQDGVLKKRETYEIMTPESVGRDASQLVLGRHSGLHGFKNRLSELGLPLSEEEAKKAYDAFPRDRGPQEGGLRRRPVRHRRGSAGQGDGDLQPGLLQHPVGKRRRADRNGTASPRAESGSRRRPRVTVPSMRSSTPSTGRSGSRRSSSSTSCRP